MLKIIKNLKIYQWVIGVFATLLFLIVSVYYFNSYKNANIYNFDFSAFKESEVDGMHHIALNGVGLRKGEYSLAVGYMSKGDASVTISLENGTNINDTLASSGGEISSKMYNFELKTGTDRGHIEFVSDTKAPMQLAFLTIASEQKIYNDGLIWGIASLLIIPLWWFGLILFDRSKHKTAVVTTLMLVLLQVFPFILQSGLHMGIDTRAHMMRIEGIFYGLLDGQFPVIVQPEWNNSYGQIGVLYPNVFLYVPAVFRILGMSQLGVCKLYLFIVILSGATIALGSARTIFKRDWQITLCVIMILMENIRLNDMYFGGKIGGSLLAEMFWPLVVAGMIELFYHNKNKWYLLAYGIAGTICCHVMSSTVMFIMIVVFAICAYKKFLDVDIRKGIGKAILLVIGLCLGTGVCFVRFYFTDWGQTALQWRDFCSTLWSLDNPFEDSRWVSDILIALTCFVILIILKVRKCEENYHGKYIVPTMVTATVLLWMSTAYFPWKILVRVPIIRYYTNMLQSGNRFLSLAGCLFAFCLPELLDRIIHIIKGRRSYESKTTIVVCIFIGCLAIVNYGIQNYRYFGDDDVTMLYYDEVIGDLEYQYDDYLPKGTQDEWYASDSGFISNEKSVKSLSYEREGTYIFYSYTNSEEGAYVEFPRFYYDGYVAEDEMANPIPVYKGDHNRTRVYLKVTDNPYIIRMWYYVPWYLTLACSLSFGAWIASIMIVVFRLKRKI